MLKNIRSKTGLAASIVFLSLLPVAIIYRTLVDFGVEIVIHIVLAAGAALLAFAVFDFKTPPWIRWTACLSTAILAIIFALQAVSLAAPANESLFYAAFTLLGRGFEGWLGNIFVIWCAVLLFTGSRGKTRAFGFVAVGLVICAKVFEYISRYRRETLPEELKLPMLLLFVWFLFESIKKKEISG
jgi:hypothetical protein